MDIMKIIRLATILLLLSMTQLAFTSSAFGVGCVLDTDCDDSLECTDNVCDAGVCTYPDTCADEFFCNGEETCTVTGCQPGNAPDCSDPFDCTSDSCDEANDQCLHSENDSVCDDELLCNGTETCDAELGCVDGSTLDCDDGFSCTDDFCSDVTGCYYIEFNVRCDNTLFCDGTEICNPEAVVHDTAGCEITNVPNCNDNVGCTADSCNEGTNSCDNVSSDSLCDDTNSCTGPDTCHPGLPEYLPTGCNLAGYADGTPCDLPGSGTGICISEICEDTCLDDFHCDDGYSCTYDQCIDGNCFNIPINSLCSDGEYCNGVESCDPEGQNPDAAGCVDVADIDCADTFDCTLDTCDEANDLCLHAPDNTVCDNLLYCDGTETCLENQGCVDGTVIDCDDDVSCTTDSCNEANDNCDHAEDDSACDDANPCMANSCDEINGCLDSPLSGNSCGVDKVCLDGVCVDGCTSDGECNDSLDCTTDSCNMTHNACINEPDNSACADSEYCNGEEICDVTLGCVDGTEITCNDSIGCTIDSCEESNDSCTNTPVDVFCDDTDPCTSDVCSFVTGCSNHDMADGASCDVLPGVSEVCVSGTCVAGCSNNGDCDDSISCTVDVCNMQTYECTNTTDNSLCDDEFWCNGAEVCVLGVGCEDGVAPNCADAVACTIDSCDEENDVCLNTATDSLCDDSLFCNGVETCNQASGCEDGVDIVCDDQTACTTDSCDEQNDKCLYTPDHMDCDDSEFCNGQEICVSGIGCQDEEAFDCDDSVLCTNDSCDEIGDQCVHTPDDSSCNDSVFCNGIEICHLTLDCQDSEAIDCDDSISCTVDSCDEVGDKCVHTPDDSSCNDSEFCNGIETCHLTLDCQDGTSVNCDDAVSCTVDSCDEVGDKCVHTPDDSICYDSEFCNGQEVCHQTLGCQDVADINCDDSLDCTSDSCDEANDKCVYTPDNSACDDFEFCNGVEVCTVGVGCEDGVQVNCNDLIDCTVDSCDEVDNACINAPDHNACDNSTLCDGQELCVEGVGCQPSAEPESCDDSIDCTDDSCDTMFDFCVNTPIDQFCDDDLYCNGAETCHQTLGCQNGTAINCEESNPVLCTIDTCNEQTDSCEHAPDDGYCDDEVFCNGLEVCNPVTDCRPGLAADCNDNIDCTVDTCGGIDDECINTPDDNLCPDLGPCKDLVECNKQTGCSYSNHPDEEVCDIDPLVNEVCRGGLCVRACVTNGDCNVDGIACTVDTCGEDGFCVHTPENAYCDNTIFCDGLELCVAGIGCVQSPNVNCDDSFACTIDSCNETEDRCDNLTQDAFCDDELWCTGDEVCNPESDNADQQGCYSINLPCDDEIACTTNLCDEEEETCSYEAVDSPCDDFEFCNGVEICTLGIGCESGIAKNCSDSIACTVDTCDEVDDVCVNTADNTACDDFEFCNGVEICTLSVGCESGIVKDCSDSIACTVDACNELDDICEHTTDNAACDDSEFCNGVEVCTLGIGCESGIAIDCSDSFACTIDTCDEAGFCVHSADDTACDDGVYCNGAEVCGLAGCRAMADIDCNDDIDCTVDSCDEAHETCKNEPDDSACDDSTWCNGAEVCNALAGCEDVDDIDCNDDITCTIDSCDEDQETCKNETDDTSCDDQKVCTDDSCHPNLGCLFENVADHTACGVDDVCINGECVPDIVDGDIDSDTVDNDMTDSDEAPYQIEFDLNAATGGTYTDDDVGLEIVVPADALASDITVTITRIADHSQMNLGCFLLSGNLWHFEPAGLVFSVPISVSIPYDTSDDIDYLAFWWSVLGDESNFEELSTTFADGIATAKTTHFSYGFVAPDCSQADGDLDNDFDGDLDTETDNPEQDVLELDADLDAVETDMTTELDKDFEAFDTEQADSSDTVDAAEQDIMLNFDETGCSCNHANKTELPPAMLILLLLAGCLFVRQKRMG